MITDDGKALTLSRLLTGTWYIGLSIGPGLDNVLEEQEWSFSIIGDVAVGDTHAFILPTRTHIGSVYLTDNSIILAYTKINKVYPAGETIQVKCNLSIT